MRCQFLLIFYAICDIIRAIRQTAFCRIFLFYPASVGAFLFSKGVIMQTPKFLRNLLQSNKYWNKNSAEFAKANEYLEKLFPGELQQDATGQYIEPKYDMTYEQFLDAQKKFDDEFKKPRQKRKQKMIFWSIIHNLCKSTKK